MSLRILSDSVPVKGMAYFPLKYLRRIAAPRRAISFCRWRWRAVKRRGETGLLGGFGINNSFSRNILNAAAVARSSVKPSLCSRCTVIDMTRFSVFVRVFRARRLRFAMI